MISSKAVRVAIAMEQSNLLRKQTRRWELLKAIYDASDADRSVCIDREDLEDSIGKIDDSVVDYLIQEDLITSDVGWDAFGITHAGLLEVEQALRHEDQPTQHFAPLTVTLHNSSNVNIQIASPGAPRMVTRSRHSPLG